MKKEITRKVPRTEPSLLEAWAKRAESALWEIGVQLESISRKWFPFLTMHEFSRQFEGRPDITVGHTFMMKVEKFVMYGVELGPFTLRLQFGRTPQIVADGVVSRSANGRIHPCADLSGYLCIGDANEVFYRAMNNGRVVDAFDVVIATLKTVSPNPYEPLDAWRREEIVEEESDADSGS